MLRNVFTHAVLAVAVSGCESPCGNEVSQTVVSPSGVLKAVTFSRNCGATTGFNTQVSILVSAGALPNEVGNTYIANGASPIQIKWRSDTELTLVVSNGEAPVKMENHVSGVKVSYEE
jgi:hypothetical protein